MSKVYTFNAGDDAFSIHDKCFISDEKERCALCGKVVSATAVQIELHNGGQFVQYGKGIQDGGYLGCWLIGSECAKKFSPELLSSNN